MTAEAENPRSNKSRPLSKLNQIEIIGLASITGATFYDGHLEFPGGYSLDLANEYLINKKNSVIIPVFDSEVLVIEKSAYLVQAEADIIHPNGEIRIIDLSTGQASTKKTNEAEKDFIDSYKLATSNREARIGDEHTHHPAPRRPRRLGSPLI